MQALTKGLSRPHSHAVRPAYTILLMQAPADSRRQAHDVCMHGAPDSRPALTAGWKGRYGSGSRRGSSSDPHNRGLEYACPPEGPPGARRDRAMSAVPRAAMERSGVVGAQLWGDMSSGQARARGLTAVGEGCWALGAAPRPMCSRRGRRGERAMRACMHVLGGYDVDIRAGCDHARRLARPCCLHGRPLWNPAWLDQLMLCTARSTQDAPTLLGDVCTRR